MNSFAVTRSALRERADVGYWSRSSAFVARYGAATYPLRPLSDLSTVVQYGCSVRATVEAGGTPIVRMNNVKDFGLDLTDLKYVDLSGVEVARYQLVPGDLLFNRTNSKELVGKCAVFRAPEVYVFASYLIRVRLSELVHPEFVAFFLNTDAGRIQIDRISRQILGMTNVNADELRSIQLPVPPIETQKALVNDLSQAIGERARLLEEAREALMDFSREIQEGSGISVRSPASNVGHAISRGAIRFASRLDANFHHPDRLAALAAIRSHSPETVTFELRSVADLVQEPINVMAGSSYLGLASVESHTGCLIKPEIGSELGQTALRFRAGDVLFCRLRPYLNKVWVADRDGFCSTEFRVLRLLPGAQIKSPEFLAAVLRTPVVMAQAIFASAGNTHPRISDANLMDLVLFAPGPDEQERLVQKESARRAQALSSRQSADVIWSLAKHQFEAALLPVPAVHR